MNGAVELLTAILLIVGAAITLIGSLGLLRLHTFYERVHAPTLGTTLGSACIALASLVYFSGTDMGPTLIEILIPTFITVTTPISLMVVVRAVMGRDRLERGKESSRQENPDINGS
jgi:multicomponent K+:H+ antiporter subunit G